MIKYKKGRKKSIKGTLGKYNGQKNLRISLSFEL